MAYQTSRNLTVAFREESTFGTLPAGTGATVFRANSGSLNLNKSPIQSGENRRDGMMSRGRHGYRTVQGNYVADLSLGTFDALLEAAFRDTWTSVLTVTASTYTTLTTTANTIVWASGNPITAGFRLHDVIRLSGATTTANNERNIRITGLSATTITVAETLTVDASPDSGVTITRPKKLVQGTTARSFSFEESEQDIDGSELFTGCRVGSVKFQMTPNGMVTVTFGLVGKDMQTLDGSNSPYFVSPTATTSLGMTAVEAAIRLNNSAVVDLTAFDITVELNAAGVNCIGSTTTPDVFTNLANVTMNLTALRQNLNYVNNFLDEDDMSLHILLTENESEPKDFISLAVPYFTLGTSTKSELGQDGARSSTFTALVGVDERGATDLGYDATEVKLQTSAS